MSLKFCTSYPMLLTLMLLLLLQDARTEKTEAKPPRGFCLIQKKQSHVQGAAAPLSESGEQGEVLRLSSIAEGKVLAMTHALRWSTDIFGDAEDRAHHGNLTNDRKEYSMYLAAAQWTKEDKAMLAGTVFALLLMDIFLLQSLRITGLKCHLLLVGLWVGIAMTFNFIIVVRKGNVAGIEWFTGYCLEWLLSMDNLFVFHIIFRLYATPRDALHKALFFGIVGAIVSRLCFFVVVSSLLEFISWFRFVAGIFLMWSGIQCAREEEGDDDEESLQDYSAIRLLKLCLGSRLLPTYGEDSRSLLENQGGQTCFTLLVPVIFTLEITDLVFALDSVSAKAAQIPDYWIAVSSSILAMFGLRAMFFVIQDLVDLFKLLKYGLCFILVFIGMELMLSDYVQLPPQAVCAVILSVFIISVAGSAATLDNRSKGAAREALENHTDAKAAASSSETYARQVKTEQD
eukprot:TRINITY_DN24022_c0_g1_i1.p1 TRINITY_DN24022_c0_g1~~TRINITY_DN24022_c0_g1_i1.p1  ORF type:complete len:458 (+),score=86.24 TRINITY_DN24022_c0_g1_i1:83-1456(+)